MKNIFLQMHTFAFLRHCCGAWSIRFNLFIFGAIKEKTLRKTSTFI